MNPAKCQFGLRAVDFLGHHVSSQGVGPLPAKVEVIAALSRPLTVKSLQEFLGMVNFYNPFIPHAAYLMRPLCEALKGKKDREEVDWCL